MFSSIGAVNDDGFSTTITSAKAVLCCILEPPTTAASATPMPADAAAGIAGGVGAAAILPTTV